MSGRQPSIGYVVSRFPALTETFVVREMDAMRELGVEVSLYPLVVQRAAQPTPASSAWLDHMHPEPWMSSRAIRTGLSLARRHPRTMLSTAGAMIAGHARSPAFLARAVALAPKSLAFGAEMRRRGVDHVHAHFGAHSALAAMLAARTAGTSFSFTVHAFDLFLDTTFLAEKVRAAAFVATISEFNRELLRRLAPDAADRIHVVRCGASAESFEAAASRAPARPGEGVRVLAVAQLAPYKGIRHLVEAAPLLRARVPQVSVTIVGDGVERSDLERRTRELGVDDVVTFTGAVSPERVAGHLAEADVFVHPSVRQDDGLMDGIPVALMEAMAAGVPVVASRLSGIPELVVDGATGLLAEPGDPKALAGAIERLADDLQLRARLTAEARRHVADEFGVERNARRLRALMEDAIASRRAGG